MSPAHLLALAGAAEKALRLGLAIYGGVVPGGKPVATAEPGSPFDPGVAATAVPVDPGLVDGAVGGSSIGDTVLVGGTDISLFVLILAGIFAAVGFIRGSRREFPTLALILPAYLLFSRGWPVVASLVNKVWNVSSVAAASRGNPGAILDAAMGQGGPGPLLGTSADAPLAQIATFGIAMMVAYVGTRGGPEANGLERMVGAVIGSVIGYLAGVFVLSRIVPDATITLLSPGSMALDWLGRLGPMAALLLVIATILFGYRSLGPGAGGARKRYG